MKNATALAAVAALGLTIAACFVNRASDAFACSSDTDCMDGRVCRTGYCVEPNCPSDCDGCDEVAKMCTMNCSSNDDCGGVTCPNGWTCIINCIGDGACNDVTCAASSRCTINCSGTNACNDISCRDACECDLTCATGACDTMTCPSTTGGTKCTVDGTPDSPCLSTVAGCAKC